MFFHKIHSLYALRKIKRFFRQTVRLYKRKEKTLDFAAKEELQLRLNSLQSALLQNDAKRAAQEAKELQQTVRKRMPKSLWERFRDFTGAILIALLIAIGIRQIWFELYTIPTGSMRPTLKENDFLIVSKTDFGLNIPLTVSHFYFDPSLVQRGSIVVFTGENMDIADADTLYFYLFPGKKQFVKRLIAKPGDLLYFYGGEIYGIDAQGNELKTLRNDPWSSTLEHIPFIRFDGKVDTPSQREGIFSPAIFYQMNKAIAKLNFDSIGSIQGEMIPQKGAPPLSQYSDLWGFKNFAMARLLTQRQVDQIYPGALRGLEKGVLYLELTHHPNLKEGHLIRDEMNRLRPDLGTNVSLLPLQQKHLDAIAEHMITCRFEVKGGIAHRVGTQTNDFFSRYFPRLSNVPDGTYEIQDGKAYQIHFGGIAQALPSQHPLYRKDPDQIQLLYNLGIEFLTHYNPSKNNRIYPSRYAYFRNKDLYLLGAPIVAKEDPALLSFLQKEKQKQALGTSVHPYSPFEDNGPPLTREGKIDVDFLRKYGLTIPEKMYLVLGDNHAMSADSRQFGFVPEANLRGGASFLFWPPGPRWGRLPQPPHPHWTLPNLVVWGAAFAVALSCSLYFRRKLRQPLKF